uniref:Major latex protein homologue n=1 Tax=Datisca glomerata TaxID=34297 RepID=Q7Y082_DATGL|nr:major latex protein homologue [Datisca glomerata]
MVLAGKLEAEIDINAPADKYYRIFKGQAHHVPNISPGIIQEVNVHEGDWDTHGSIKIWNYTVDGKTEVFKERVEFDDEKRAATLTGVEGSTVLNHSKTFKGTYQVTPKGNGSLAKLTLVYEKVKEDVPDPVKYLALDDWYY